MLKNTSIVLTMLTLAASSAAAQEITRAQRAYLEPLSKPGYPLPREQFKWLSESATGSVSKLERGPDTTTVEIVSSNKANKAVVNVQLAEAILVDLAEGDTLQLQKSPAGAVLVYKESKVLAVLVSPALKLANSHTASSEAVERACAMARPLMVELASSVENSILLKSTLDATSDNVVLIAKLVRDEERKEDELLAGFAWRRWVGDPWRVTHRVSECSDDKGMAYTEGLAAFLLNSVQPSNIEIKSLDKELQKKLLSRLVTEEAAILSRPKFSKIADPLKGQYQSPNGWAAELLAAAKLPGDEDFTAKSGLRALAASGYVPETVQEDPVALSQLAFRSKSIAVEDHRKGFRGELKVASWKSIVDWLNSQRLEDGGSK